MAPSSDTVLRVAGAVSILVVLFYVGRPVYWALEDHLRHTADEDVAEISEYCCDVKYLMYTSWTLKRGMMVFLNKHTLKH